VTIAFTGGTIVEALEPPGLSMRDVLVKEGRVVAESSPAGNLERIDCSGCLVIPGNVCTHTHLYSSLARGMPFALETPRTFLQILQRIWWRLDRALDEESIRASALIGGMEALLSGTTTLVDHHASPHAIDGSLDVIADALDELGVRSMLCYEVTDRDGPERAAAGLEENGRFLRASGRRSLTRGMVGAHASFTLSNETLQGCVELSHETGSGLHVHVAEDVADQTDSEARFGLPVVERLAEAGALTERSLLAHCVHVHPSELDLIRSSSATVAHNARSNMNNGVGRAPAEALGDRIALGTDGIGADMFAESQAAHWRAREDDVRLGPGVTLARLAQGSRFAGRAFDEPLLGSFAPGAPADIVVLDYASPAPLTSSNLSGHWMFGLSASRVRDVMVNGELVVRDRRPTKVDQEKLGAEAAGAAERLWQRVEQIPAHEFEPVGAAD
jgi:putative selenium metabolism protein SsnA